MSSSFPSQRLLYLIKSPDSLWITAFLLLPMIAFGFLDRRYSITQETLSSHNQSAKFLSELVPTVREREASEESREVLKRPLSADLEETSIRCRRLTRIASKVVDRGYPWKTSKVRDVLSLVDREMDVLENLRQEAAERYFDVPRIRHLTGTR